MNKLPPAPQFNEPVPAPVLEHLAQLDLVNAVATVASLPLDGSSIAAALADAALEHAEVAPDRAAHWLEIARSLISCTAELALEAKITYAQARLHLQTGDIPAAESSLLSARKLWKAVGDEVSLARSGLGLTQILTMQGRYAEAELISARTVRRLKALAGTDGGVVPRLIVAHRNHANLLRYQEKHESALAEYEQARHILSEHRTHRNLSAADQQHLAQEEAHLHLNRATVLMSLDRPEQAETALHAAITIFDESQDMLNRGKAHSNLGSLYLRTGRYAVALSEFDKANADLLGDVVLHPDLPVPLLRQADVTLLDQAMVYVTLNLLPEARTSLTLCQRIFEDSDRPYERGQIFYTLGLVYLRSGNSGPAQSMLEQAERIFLQLENRYWLNRTRLALAVHSYQCGEPRRAHAHLRQLSAPDEAGAAQTLDWDVGTRMELCSLRLHLFLDSGETALARQEVEHMARVLGDEAYEVSVSKSLDAKAFPHLYMRLYHALGQVELASGQHPLAHRHFLRALHLLESQRANLPLEELRTAFLNDKGTLYADFVVSLLNDAHNDGEAKVAEAFSLAERARARALLERLFASVPDADTSQIDPELLERRNSTRQRLHWLYNQLLGGAASAQEAQAWQHEIWTHESTLQKLEQTATSVPSQAQPVTLPALQGVLDADQQAVVYFVAGEEVLAFVVGAGDVHVVRRLCTTARLEKAQRELRFQLGRAELGREYLARNQRRLHSALKSVLGDLYDALYAPLAHHIYATRLLFIPHGTLHLLPLHLLWSGDEYLLQRVECSYAPSASMAVSCRNRAREHMHKPYDSLAGFALTDPGIPHAVAEIEAAASHFGPAWCCLDEAATLDSLQAIAEHADVVHLATHGLFRSDNPFFSALKLADGWIDVREIYRLSLRARLVVLSACKSGSGRVQGGDEVVGLARGFLGAGAHALLVSAWNVHDASAATLMDRFYTQLTENHVLPATALRTAQLEAAARNEHPYFWGSFFLIG